MVLCLMHNGQQDHWSPLVAISLSVSQGRLYLTCGRWAVPGVDYGSEVSPYLMLEG
jgi:hypothetical protein